ncbi:hypothetical protein SAMN05660297_00555 [Natronincola peptidivorans]|uniref:SMODS and SLOG-associating 2TM effector domain-containing protein n=1 Tax=Natronincola peptidivorans TaxID=426128 RepID=A0A1H9ZH99_9FIRM|nr:hypothetical protein [Natronincola peptidivorans]SES81062.1 hypothetical protein SAMN05660297_00555 [Natronincola peptidivorans]
MKKPIDFQLKDTRIPIIVGMTGHRDLVEKDVPILETKIESILEGIQEKYQETPIYIMTALAEGADTLMAQIALKLGIPYIVALPMKKEDYLEDFQEETARKTFLSLLEKAYKYYEGPYYKEVWQNQQGERAKYYEDVGVLMAEYSDFLIALWDGKYLEDMGGTSQVVKFKVAGVSEEYKQKDYLFSMVETGYVHHILTPRRRHTAPLENAFDINVYAPKGEDENQRYLKHLNNFNKDLLKLEEEKVEKNFQDNILQGYFPNPEKMNGNGNMEILKFFLVADMLSLKYQRIKNRFIEGIFCLVLIGILCFNLYGVFEKDAILIGYLSLYLIAMVLYKVSTRYDFNNKHLDYRSIAEGLRIQFYWNLAGLNEKVENYYLNKNRSELEWVRSAIKSVQILNFNTEASLQRESLAMVKGYWIDSQKEYFKKATLRHDDKISRGTSKWKKLFVIGLCIPLMILVMKHLFGQSLSEDGTALLLGLSTILPAIGALLAAKDQNRSFKELSKRYSQVGAIHERASSLLEESMKRNQMEKAQRIIFLLGKESLNENGDWISMHREKTIDLPK